MRSLGLKRDGFDALRSEYAVTTDSRLAEILGVDKGTLSRVVNGKSVPGPTFISAVLLSFPVKFEDVFEPIGETAIEVDALAEKGSA